LIKILDLLTSLISLICTSPDRL